MKIARSLSILSCLSATLTTSIVAAAASAPTAQSATALITTHRIPSAIALAAVSEAVTTCARHGDHVSAVLVDADGVVQASLRGDGAGAHTMISAEYKAYTAASFLPIHHQTKTSELKTPLADGSGIVADRAASLFNKVPGLIASAGGVIIQANGEVIGGIGVGGGAGGQWDEACAAAGAKKVADSL